MLASAKVLGVLTLLIGSASALSQQEHDATKRMNQIKTELQNEYNNNNKKNSFIYHQFHDDFHFQVDDGEHHEKQVKIGREDVLGTEYYNLVTFFGSGWLEKKPEADGTTLNWGWYGNVTTENDGNRLVFSNIDDPNQIPPPPAPDHSNE